MAFFCCFPEEKKYFLPAWWKTNKLKYKYHRLNHRLPMLQRLGIYSWVDSWQILVKLNTMKYPLMFRTKYHSKAPQMSDTGQTGITWWQTISYAHQTADLFSHSCVNLGGIKLFICKIWFTSDWKSAQWIPCVPHNT